MSWACSENNSTLTTAAPNSNTQEPNTTTKSQGVFSMEAKNHDGKVVFRFKKDDQVLTRQSFIDSLADKSLNDFRVLVNKSIAELPKGAGGYQLKAPLINAQTKEEVFFLVAVPASGLAYQASAKAFYPYLRHCEPKFADAGNDGAYAGHFLAMWGTGFEEVKLNENKNLKDGVAAFKGGSDNNPNKNKIMLSPCPFNADPNAVENNALGHIFAYAQKLSEAGQQERLHSFWYGVGVMAKKMFNNGALQNADGQNAQGATALFINTHGHGVNYLHFRVELEPSYYSGVEFLTTQKEAQDFYKKVFGNEPSSEDQKKNFFEAKLENNTERFVLAPVTINQELSDIYNGNYPKATLLADYNAGKNPVFMLAADLGSDFEARLPAKIQTILEDKKLLGQNKVDIHWVVQLREFIGGNEEGGQKNLSLLKAHTWADADVPHNFPGDRINAYLDYGVFEASFDVAYEVKIDQLKPFNVHTHDGMLSPRTAQIKLPGDINESVSFYSLVVGKPYQKNEERAIVTLHWVLGGDQNLPTKNEDIYHFGKVAFEPFSRNPEYPMWHFANNKLKNARDLISELRKSPLKNSHLMQKLDSLLGQ